MKSVIVLGNAGVEKFLIEIYGEKKGTELYKRQQQRFEELLSCTVGKTKNQLKTLTKNILPSIALYKTLAEEFDLKETALEVFEKYMTCVSVNISKSYKRLQRLPFFYHFFRIIVAYVVTKSDNWTVKVITNNSKALEFNTTKCLWFDTCADNGCPELCRHFCDADNITFGSLQKVKFFRTGNISAGCDCCDFHFAKS